MDSTTYLLISIAGGEGFNSMAARWNASRRLPLRKSGRCCASEPRYRGVRHAERPRDVGQRLASVTSCSGFLLLVVVELRWPAHVLASGLGPGSAVAGALADQMPLELSQATQDCQDEPAVRCGRVGPGISSDLKPAPFSGDFASLDASTYRIDGEGFIHIAGQDSEGKSHD